MLLLCLLLPWTGRAQAPAGGKAPSVGTMLNADGTLRPGGAGSFDATGYRMTLDPASGEPSFRPTGAGDENWQEGFGANGATNSVYVVARASNGDLYVGGRFTSVGAVQARRIAKWNGTTWSALGNGAARSNSANNGVNDIVTALAVVGTDLYVGGDFTAARSSSGVVAVNYIAKWDGATWSGLGNGTDVATATNNGLNSRPDVLAVLHNDLYAGGFFTAANNGDSPVQANYIAKWDGTAWSALGNGTAPATSANNGANEAVFALAVLNNDLYVGGQFTDVRNGSSPVAASSVAKWDGTAWSALGNGTAVATNTNNGVNPQAVFALTVMGTDLYVGGRFSAVRNGSTAVAANNIAKWNGTAWSALGNGTAVATSTNNGVSDGVFALAVLNNELYIAGYFSTVRNGSNPVSASSVAKWDGTTWSALGNGTAVATSTNNGVNYTAGCLVVLSNDLYVGGDFTIVNNSSSEVAASRIARWNGTAWSALDTGQNGADATIYAVARASNGDLYVGGEFTSIGATVANNVAKWNGTTWSALGNGSAVATSINNGVNNRVNTLAMLNNDLYVGGYFFRVFNGTSELAAGQIAKWNGTVWSTLGNGTAIATSTNNGVNGFVLGLAVLNNELYVGGTFSAVRNGTNRISANHVAKWDGTVWSTLGNGTALATSTNNGTSGNISALVVRSTDLYVGGSFTTAFNGSSAVAANSVAKWNGTSWSALGNGTAAATSTNNGIVNLNFPEYGVNAMTFWGNDLYVGGNFTTARTSNSVVTANNIAKWDGIAWSALGSGSATATSTNNGVSDVVNALAAGSGELYVGGYFLTVNNSSGAVPATMIAKWNGTTWNTLGTGLNGNVRALVASGNQLIAGGDFTVSGDGSKVNSRFGIYNVVANPLSVVAGSNAAALHLYPNPASGQATLTGAPRA
ncbi:beta strand repeat-containing protein, partial [Hymenobacter persicinus]